MVFLLLACFLSVPPATVNPLRLPMFKGSFTTSVVVASGSALDDVILKSHDLDTTSLPRKESSPESQASASFAAAGGGLSSRLFDVLLSEDAAESAVDVTIDSAKFDGVRSLIRTTEAPVARSAVYVCCIDGASPGGGASTGNLLVVGPAFSCGLSCTRYFSLEVFLRLPQRVCLPSRANFGRRRSKT